MDRLRKNSFCSYCGQGYADGQAWPRTCTACASVSYQNPLPVGVCLVPIDDGLLCVRRNIEPGRGKIALPGGFLDVGETWQEGCVRELREETGLVIDAGEVHLFQALSVREGFLLLFGLVRPRKSDELPPWVCCAEETQECLVVNEPVELAFPLHTQVMREYFHSQNDRRDAGPTDLEDV